MKVTKMMIKKQIALLENAHNLCNQIIKLKYTNPQQRNERLINLTSIKSSKKQIKLLQEVTQKESQQDELQLQKDFKSLEKICKQLKVNMTDKENKKLDIYKLKTRISQKKSYLLKKDPTRFQGLDKDYFPLINQQQVMKMLQLPYPIVTYLRDNNRLESIKKDGRVYFSHSSIKKFQKSFDVKDYLNVSQCKNMLEELNYYDIYYKGTTTYRFGFSTTIKNLINTDREEIKLETVKFASTIYVSKKSMEKCLTYLKNLEQGESNSSIALIPLKKRNATLIKKKKPFQKRKILKSIIPQKPHQ